MRLLGPALVSGLALIALGAWEVHESRRAEPKATIADRAEVVFDWSSEACEEWDIPDLPARAFRDASGRAQIVIAHSDNRRLIGPDLAHLRHECRVVMGSRDDSRPSMFSGLEWIASPYTLDGKTVFALVHDEFQGHRRAGRCRSGDYERCWYNAITLALSRDGGRTYSEARRAPRHLVAAASERYAADTGPVGLFEPSNIVRDRRSGQFYAAARIVGPGGSPRGTCVMRTTDLSDPSSWRGWDGNSFSVEFVDPYARKPGSDAGLCEPVAHREIEEMSQSLTYNTYFRRFMLVGTASIPGRGRSSWGIQFALSDDLVHWTRRRLILEVETPWTYSCGDPDPVLYPSLIDPRSPSRNFETVGRDAYVYLTRFNYSDCRQGADRDLIRFPVRFSR